MKKLVTDSAYTFDASARTVVAGDFTSLDVIMLITNVTDNIIIYNFADPAKGGALSGTTLTLDYNTTSMDNSDRLQIWVEDNLPLATEATLAQVLGGFSGLAAESTLSGIFDFYNEGATPYHLVSAASTNATNVKAGPGQVYFITASNVNAAARYLKLYNKASAPTVGTDVPVLTFIIPGNTTGAGTNIPIPAVGGIGFTTGISFALTTEATDAGNTGVGANEIVVNLGYK